jgi:argininosuccinate synthase
MIHYCQFCFNFAVHVNLRHYMEDDAGAYDQKDAAGFIKLQALRLRTLAKSRGTPQ